MVKPVVETKKLNVEVYTPQFRIVGDCHLPNKAYRGRLTDLLNEIGANFVPITGAVIYNRNTNHVIAKIGCAIVNKSYVELILPVGEEAPDRSIVEEIK